MFREKHVKRRFDTCALLDSKIFMLDLSGLEFCHLECSVQVFSEETAELVLEAPNFLHYFTLFLTQAHVHTAVARFRLRHEHALKHK